MHKIVELVVLGCGMLAPAIYLFTIMYAAAGYPDYQHCSQFISELGTHNSPKAAYFNAGLSVTGILMMAFAFGVDLSPGNNRYVSLTQLGLACFGFTVALMGSFPYDPGCPRAPISWTGIAHGLLGLLGAVILAATTVYLGWAWREIYPVFAVYSLVIGLLTVFILIILMVWQIPQRQGLLQRLYASLIFGWLLTLSLLLLIK